MSVCAVIPAAGRGTRLGADRPKILVEVAPGLSIWDVLSKNLAPFVDAIDVILSPEGRPFFDRRVNSSSQNRPNIDIQTQPKGMGHAIFCGLNTWKKFDHILIIWGDQVHVSPETFQACLSAHKEMPAPHLTLPVVSLASPYVEYVFNPNGALTHIKQSREGDICMPGGWGDVGTFLLTTQGLEAAWNDFMATKPAGAVTGELNFLPFMVYLSQVKKWPITRLPVKNVNEARGINTPEDLAFFKKLYTSKDSV